MGDIRAAVEGCPVDALALDTSSGTGAEAGEATEMGLAIGDEHEELAATVRRWTEARHPVAAARQLLDAPADALPELWKELGPLGWVGPGRVGGDTAARATG